MRQYWERPPGTNDFVLEDMAHRMRIQTQLLTEFARWGYALAETPMLEYAETFTQGIHQGEEERLFRMFDAGGRTLALRPEMTAPVARLAASSLADEPLPLRVGYWAKTYREQGGRVHDRAEVTQAGVECIGGEAVDADAEVIALIAGSLHRLGVQGFRIALGHTGYVQALVRGLPDESRIALRHALIDKDLVAYERLLQSVGWLSPDSAALAALPSVRGGRAEIARARELAAGNAAAQAACAELEETWLALAAHGVAEDIHIDLGLYLHHEYYTGIVVEGYADALGQPICFGGRYDNLLSQFGRPAPATGCVLHVERLMAIVPVLLESETRIFVTYEAERRLDALFCATRLRAAGYVVVATLQECVSDARMPRLALHFSRHGKSPQGDAAALALWRAAVAESSLQGGEV